MQKLVLAAAIAAVAHAIHGSSEASGAKQRRLRAEPDAAGVVKPMRFNRRLLICNAYAGNSAMLVSKNEKEELADAGHAIAFRECRYIENELRTHDKLELQLKDIDIHGTFEVGDLPASDAVLLLVLGRRKASAMVSFQSFAFPTSSDSSEAQLAVIDAFRGNATSSAHLRMEDHVTAPEKQKVSRRVEQLSFNRVYAIEEGAYDASLEDNKGKSNLHAVRLQRNQNYVMLRTGDDEVGEGQSLVVFPEAEFKSSARSYALAAGAIMAMFVAMFL